MTALEQAINRAAERLEYFRRHGDDALTVPVDQRSLSELIEFANMVRNMNLGMLCCDRCESVMAVALGRCDPHVTSEVK